jgi:lysozyme
LYFGIIRTNNPSIRDYPIKGIDISHYQNNINWKKLRTEKINFIYIKATEGASLIDDKFKANWANALNNKYKVGAYHFYIPNRNGKDQAANFIKNVPDLRKALPPVLDLEFDVVNKSKKSRSQLISEIDDFLDVIELHYQHTPIIYTNVRFYNYFIKGNFDGYKIWIRDTRTKPRLSKNIWIIWQYTNRGRFNGIKGYVDVNVINGTMDDLYY